ncbi:hypothetical protein DIURU_005584 [Diutina rugosa]|uniref:F-box domain-containing protein n=1 Tax=Diutina rugosa TaxID=5481 RepID=A0A642UCT5_DIURU|nr:uncharacterized protein DIURU_005584 [Diutina rugosa]KAA8896844.1 hypothetical protein DIURU_005584 [Diutina rugosa]
MNSITCLPIEVVERILDHTDRPSQLALARTSRAFRHVVNRRLYKQIMLVNQPIQKDDYTTLALDRLQKFCDELSPYNFQFINKVIIQTQSDPSASISYTGLYKKMLRLWDLLPRHQITVINYDLNNLRIHQSLNQYIYKYTSHYVIEDSCLDQTHINYKINNLHNWMIFDYSELNQLPVNPNLRELHIFIERSNHQMSKQDDVPLKVLRNFANLESLYLTTPLATSQLQRYFANFDFAGHGPVFSQLRQLSVCNLHSYKDHSLLTYEGMSRILPFEQLESLELKLSCTHHDCDCILQFFIDMPYMPNLKHFMLINTNTKSSQSNMAQYQQLLESPEFFRKIDHCESLYLNINELNTLTLGVRSEFKFSKLCEQFKSFEQLKSVTLPDFFNHWLATVPDFFDQTMNVCKCTECIETRGHFAKRAKMFSPRSEAPLAPVTPDQEDTNPSNTLLTNESSVKYLNYIASQAKKQHRYINENLSSINSIITSAEKPVMKDSSLERYKRLFSHNYVGYLARTIKGDQPEMKVILGGMEF